MWLDVNVHKEAKYYQSYLDGKKLENCFAANEEEGWADVHEVDEKGVPIIVVMKDGVIVREKFNGKGNNFLSEGETSELKKKRIYGKVELRKII